MRSRIWLRLAVAIGVLLAVPASAWGDEGVVHVVQPGENLYRIALRYGTDYHSLAAANGIANPHQIYVGQRLVIPGDGGE